MRQPLSSWFASSGGLVQIGSLHVAAVSGALVRPFSQLSELHHRSSPGSALWLVMVDLNLAQALMCASTILQLFDPQPAHMGQTSTTL